MNTDYTLNILFDHYCLW